MQHCWNGNDNTLLGFGERVNLVVLLICLAQCRCLKSVSFLPFQLINTSFEGCMQNIKYPLTALFKKSESWKGILLQIFRCSKNHFHLSFVQICILCVALGLFMILVGNSQHCETWLNINSLSGFMETLGIGGMIWSPSYWGLELSWRYHLWVASSEVDREWRWI